MAASLERRRQPHPHDLPSVRGGDNACPERQHVGVVVLAGQPREVEVVAERGTPPAETAMDLVVEDESRVTTAYFTISEDNIRRELGLPWVSFCSDCPAPAAEGEFLQWSTHPRTYGAFARVLGKYVRDEGALPLEEAVRRLTALPASNLRLSDRGLLTPGYCADVVVFDPERIEDRATYDEPHRYATGVVHVAVNGTLVVRDGEHTGALPGRFVRGPGSTRV